MRAYHRIYLALVVSNTMGAFLIFFFLAYIDLETFHANIAFWRGSNADWLTFTAVMLILNLLGMLLAHAVGRRLAGWERQVKAGLPADRLPLRWQRWAATYPLVVALISLAVWLLAGFFFAQGGLTVVSTSPEVFLRTFIGVSLVGGVTTATLVFLLADAVWQDQLPIFFPTGAFLTLDVPRISARLRLVATFLLTGFVPLVILAVSARNGILSSMATGVDPYELLDRLQLTVLFIVGVALVSNILLSWLTARSLLRPLTTLSQAMTQVAQGDLSPRVPVQANDELGQLSHHFNHTLAQLTQSQKMRDLFGRYVSREVAERVITEGADLGGETVAATALFADIRDFTTLSERLPPQQVVNILNRYYTHMVDVIVTAGGMVNKFGGDSLLAIFGVPIRQPDHALRAVHAAWQMTRALAEFNAEQMALGLPQLTIGIGISSGEMVAGNIGGETRLEYTVIGDPVNLASRLQSLTKEWGTPVLLSEDTESLLEGDTAVLRPRDRVTVKGKARPTLVYELLAA